MCGISGIFHKERNKPVSNETLAAMSAIQYHRGPDGLGVLTLEAKGVGFSHTRLSIIDLQENRARQPFLSEDGNVLMAHNGEFYDYQRIRAVLSTKGYRFRTKSDSEILIHLYRHQGMSASLPELRGEFAFALFDKNNDTLYLARDRFGIKPQYWAITKSGDFIFGSEIKSVFAHPDVRREMSEQGAYHQLIQVMVPGTTAFADVHQVPPGFYLKVTRESGVIRVEQIRYWDLDFPRESDRDASLPDSHWVDVVRKEILEAVELRLHADVPVGCYLSGGIDSCAILGLASAIRQDSVKAFTIGFDHDSYDESPIARRMAESVSADQDILRLSADHLYDHFVETHWHTERTIYNTLAVAKFLMSRHVRDSGYKVVLTGEGSDELFAGYPSFRKDFFRHGISDLPESEKREWEEVLHANNALFRGAMLSLQDFSHPGLVNRVGFMPACIENWISMTPNAYRLFHGDTQARLAGYDPGNAIADSLPAERLVGRHALDRAQYVWIKTMLEGQILTWGGDRVDMANSMEARPPFLDHHLAEASAHIPPRMRIHGKREKHVLREAMRGILPEELYNREKFAFMAPPAHTDPKKLSALQELKERYLRKVDIEDLGFLDWHSVENLWASYTNRDTPTGDLVQQDALLNHVLGLHILHKTFVKDDVPQRAARELGSIKERGAVHFQSG